MAITSSTPTPKFNLKVKMGLLYFKVIKPFVQARITLNYDNTEENKVLPSALPEGASKPEGSAGSAGSRG